VRNEVGRFPVSRTCVTTLNPFRFPAVKLRLMLEYKAQESTCLDKLNVRKPLVFSFLRNIEDMILYQPSSESDNSSPRLIEGFSNASSGRTVCFGRY
jgi:hypothetical protein